MKDQNISENDDRIINQIYNEVLAIVYNRGISRNDKLSALSISEKIGVSRTPVSFVLYRMELEGLLKNEGKGGWEIRSININDLIELFEIKEILFPQLVKLATLKFIPGNTAKLFIFVDEIERSLQMNNLSGWHAADKGFNKLLSISANNSILSSFLRICDNQLYRISLTYLSLPNSNRNIFKIYRDIAFAISSENSELAYRLAINYVQGLSKVFGSFMLEVIIPLLGQSN